MDLKTPPLVVYRDGFAIILISLFISYFFHGYCMIGFVGDKIEVRHVSE